MLITHGCVCNMLVEIVVAWLQNKISQFNHFKIITEIEFLKHDLASCVYSCVQFHLCNNNFP